MDYLTALSQRARCMSFGAADRLGPLRMCLTSSVRVLLCKQHKTYQCHLHIGGQPHGLDLPSVLRSNRICERQPQKRLTCRGGLEDVL
jgi:hypothetical protein